MRTVRVKWVGVSGTSLDERSLYFYFQISLRGSMPVLWETWAAAAHMQVTAPLITGTWRQTSKTFEPPSWGHFKDVSCGLGWFQHFLAQPRVSAPIITPWWKPDDFIFCFVLRQDPQM